MIKKIVLFSDGTGNSSAKAEKTNVWRLFQMLDQRNSSLIAASSAANGSSKRNRSGAAARARAKAARCFSPGLRCAGRAAARCAMPRRPSKAPGHTIEHRPPNPSEIFRSRGYPREGSPMWYKVNS